MALATSSLGPDRVEPPPSSVHVLRLREHLAGHADQVHLHAVRAARQRRALEHQHVVAQERAAAAASWRDAAEVVRARVEPARVVARPAAGRPRASGSRRPSRRARTRSCATPAAPPRRGRSRAPCARPAGTCGPGPTRRTPSTSRPAGRGAPPPARAIPSRAWPRGARRSGRTPRASEGNGPSTISGARSSNSTECSMPRRALARSSVKSVHSFRWLSNDATATRSSGMERAQHARGFVDHAHQARRARRVQVLLEEEDDQPPGRGTSARSDARGVLGREAFGVGRRRVDPERGLHGHRRGRPP